MLGFAMNCENQEFDLIQIPFSLKF